MKKTLKFVISMTVIISLIMTMSLSASAIKVLHREVNYNGLQLEYYTIPGEKNFVMEANLSTNNGTLPDNFSSNNIASTCGYGSGNNDLLVGVQFTSMGKSVYGYDNLSFGAIGSNAFAGCNNLDYITAARKISFKDYALKNSGISSVNLLNVGIIGKRVFENCPNLEEVWICGTIDSVDKDAFLTGDDRKFDLHIPNNVSLDGVDLKNCNVIQDLEYVYVPETCTEDGYCGYKYNDSIKNKVNFECTGHLYDLNSTCKRCKQKIESKTFAIGEDCTYIFEGATSISFTVRDKYWPDGNDWEYGTTFGQASGSVFNYISEKVHSEEIKKPAKDYGYKTNEEFTLRTVDVEIQGSTLHIRNNSCIVPFVVENIQAHGSASSTGSVLSEGSTTIVIGVLIAAVVGLGGYILGSKRKKPVTENSDEE